MKSILACFALLFANVTADDALFLPISNADGSQIGTLAVNKNQEPADAVHQFMVQHNLAEEFRATMMEHVCAVVKCNRAEPVIYSKTVNIDGKAERRIEILRGQEPADVIFAALKPLGVTFEGRRQLFQDIKAAQIPFSREHALLFSENILLADDGEFSERFVLLDDGREPVDVIYQFCREHSIEQRFHDLAAVLLPQLCGIAVCSREVPLVFQNSVNDEDGRQLGTLSIFLGEEPIDVIDQFVQSANVPTSNYFAIRQSILEAVCSSIACTRSVPVVYKKDLNNVNGQHVGGLEIFEGTDTVYLVDMLVQRINATPEERSTIKKQILQDACANERVKCPAAN